eukprot:TRINITY_DN21316_c0_g1_i1.p1 TRINITY_DN21316_c0_g1~~TRINITY_DN21316_c0_g1_i1.p1  ORF type:complete len:148 (-),score=46.81 TRINITY_DN21316_c0_g1_i1:116-559(-)
MQVNPTVMDDWLYGQDEVKALISRLTDIKEENNKLASEMLARQPEIEEASRKTDAALEAAKQIRESVEGLLEQRKAIAAKMSPEHLVAKLGEQSNEADMDAENLLQEAIDAPGAMDAAAIASFRQSFMQKKIEKHKRLGLKAALERK